MAVDPVIYRNALEDFERARQQAAMEQLLARFSGKSNELLAYEEIRQQLKVTNQRERGLQEIPLEKIVGSVGRYKDFTRSFLPKTDVAEHKWVKVKTAVIHPLGVPPIDVYQVGDAYFVIDGNHRVSVARQMNSETISAYVTEVKTRVPLSADDNPEEIICKARYVQFLDKTNLDKLRPDCDLLMTFCGNYHLILEHIDVHRHYLGIEREAFVPYAEAVASWYDNVYLPLIQMVRSQGVLRYFPERTEADIYFLLAEHQAELVEALGYDVAPETVVNEVARQKKGTVQSLMQAGARLKDLVTPDELESGPPPGTWRLERVNKRMTGRLFDDMLVPVTNDPADWRALDQAIWVAKLGNSRILGLHVLEQNGKGEGEEATAVSPETVQQMFTERCEAAGVRYAFAVEWGNYARKVVERAVYSDGVLLPVNHAPESASDRVQSALQTILRRCPRPILTVPTGEVRPLTKALLAYGGKTTTAEEALFVAAYLLSRYEIELSVLSVGDTVQTNRALGRVRDYLGDAHEQATYYAVDGPVEKAILDTAVEAAVEFIIIGSFGYGPLRALLLGSTANRVLLDSPYPMLICR